MLNLKIKELILSENDFNEEAFNNLALQLFEYQLTHNQVYQNICKLQGKTSPNHWKEIPLITTELYKTQKLFCKSDEEIKKTFLSSGSTTSERSKHYLSQIELELYETSLWKTFSRALIPHNKELELYVLTESPEEATNSSLVHMFETVRQKIGVTDDCYFLHSGKLDLNRLKEKLTKSSKPVLLAGTAFSFVHLLDSNFPEITLPPNSRIMETGGFKGRSREVSKSQLYKDLCKRFNLPLHSIVGQYGMSECGTQYYDYSFVNSSNDTKYRWKKAPSWSRVRILNPNNLTQEVSEGESGLIAIYDLANVDSAAFLLTGDLAIRRPEEHFEVLGRAQSLTSKGCSLTTDLSLKK